MGLSMSTDSRTIDERKREIEALLEDYTEAHRAALVWFAQWKERNSGFRCKRAQRAS